MGSSSNSSSRPDLNIPVKLRQGVSPLVVINLEGLYSYSVLAITYNSDILLALKDLQIYF